MMPEISIHALLAESDKLTVCQNGQLPDFYPRSPCGERLDDILAGVNELLISIHALLAESDALAPKQNPTQQRISIHALLAESDAVTTLEGGSLRDFYPRSPCGERRGNDLRGRVTQGFLSTLSLRRATSQQPAGTTSTTYFYPRSPCGERRPTLFDTAQHIYFYPRSPCGERHTHPVAILVRIVFLSTLSLRRATAETAKISNADINFYPRSPCGERPTTNGPEASNRAISIHALLAESDWNQQDKHHPHREISIHALLAESDVLQS